MTEVEELRSHLADSSPEALERARVRLRAAQRDDSAAQGEETAAPAAGAQPPWRRRIVVALAGATSSAATRPHRSALRLGALGLAVAATASIALLVGIGSGGGESGGGGGGGLLAPAPASARTVLVRAAASAAQADDGGIARMPNPDEYFFLEIRGTYLDGGASAGMPTQLHTRRYRSWLSETREGRVQTSADSPAAPVGRAHLYIGNERFSHDELTAFDPAPRELYERILHGITPGQGSSPHAEVFVQLVDALRQTPLPPRLRSTILLALAEIPGLRLTGETKDSLGRPGLGIAYVERSREDQQHELILNRDGALLAERATTRSGKLLEDAVVVRQAITTDLTVPRG